MPDSIVSTSKLRLISKNFQKKCGAVTTVLFFLFFCFLGVSFCGFGGFRVYLFMSRERQI